MSFKELSIGVVITNRKLIVRSVAHNVTDTILISKRHTVYIRGSSYCYNNSNNCAIQFDSQYISLNLISKQTLMVTF